MYPRMVFCRVFFSPGYQEPAMGDGRTGVIVLMIHLLNNSIIPMEERNKKAARGTAF
jgi:hypothetical protein